MIVCVFVVSQVVFYFLSLDFVYKSLFIGLILKNTSIPRYIYTLRKISLIFHPYKV